MNTKRQTIWLVSMLSLMVVLSAYYLFTQDLNDADKLSDSSRMGQNAAEVSGTSGNSIAEEIAQQGDKETSGILNQQVLKQLEREGFAQTGLFSELSAKRDQHYTEEHNRIMSVIAEVSSNPDESAAAIKELEGLEEKSSRIKMLESTLKDQYEMAMIAEENKRYKVVVTSEKLEKKDAASIIDQVMTVMEVGADQVSVQYVPEP